MTYTYYRKRVIICIGILIIVLYGQSYVYKEEYRFVCHLNLNTLQ